MDNVWQITGTSPEKPAADFGDRGNEPVRASISQSDTLMRILGRPNREQVVTTRPAQLTTLQALDLTNGETLAKTLEKGGVNLLAKNRDAKPEQVIVDVFQRALQRSPTQKELSDCSTLLGDSVSLEGITDLLWTVFMLPEFQIIQ